MTEEQIGELIQILKSIRNVLRDIYEELLHQHSPDAVVKWLDEEKV